MLPIIVSDIEMTETGYRIIRDVKPTVCRDQVYVGKVVKTDKIYRYEGDTDSFRTKPGQLGVSSYFSLRSMLFVPNEEKFARDLLYKSPNYPALNITDDETCLNLGENSIVVTDICSLAQLLEYFGYDENLTFEAVKEIRKRFFTGRFAMDNCELFGMKESTPEEYTFYENGVEVTDPKQKQKRINAEKISQWLGHRSFSGISESPLSHEYFDILDTLGDDDWRDRLHGFYEKGNMFKPDRKEGPIKSLRRF